MRSPPWFGSLAGVTVVGGPLKLADAAFDRAQTILWFSGTGHVLGLPHQRVGRALEGACQRRDRVEGGRSQPALEDRDVGAVKTRTRGELLLTEPGPLS